MTGEHADKQLQLCSFTYRRANNGRITFFKEGGCPYFVLSFVRTLFIQRHEILSRNTKDTKLTYGENSNSLSYLVLNRYRIVTDRQTGGQTDRRTELP